MCLTIEKIVSGGQTGVDQAALNIAVESGILIGGWCPKGGKDENGMNILDVHPLTEASTSLPDERTTLNVRDSDGTFIMVPCWPLPEKIKDGTKLTIDEAQRLGKPYFIGNLSESSTLIENALDWCEQHDIRILNIGGPRESSCPGIYAACSELFRELFTRLKSKPQCSI